jgi:hypothetical protein
MEQLLQEQLDDKSGKWVIEMGNPSDTSEESASEEEGQRHQNSLQRREQ